MPREEFAATAKGKLGSELLDELRRRQEPPGQDPPGPQGVEAETAAAAARQAATRSREAKPKPLRRDRNARQPRRPNLTRTEEQAAKARAVPVRRQSRLPEIADVEPPTGALAPEAMHARGLARRAEWHPARTNPAETSPTPTAISNESQIATTSKGYTASWRWTADLPGESWRVGVSNQPRMSEHLDPMLVRIAPAPVPWPRLMTRMRATGAITTPTHALIRALCLPSPRPLPHGQPPAAEMADPLPRTRCQSPPWPARSEQEGAKIYGPAQAIGGAGETGRSRKPAVYGRFSCLKGIEKVKAANGT